MAQINKPTDYFNTKLYVGDGTTSNAITGVGFQPDWVWTKNRTNARGHGLFDSVRGADKWLQSNNNLAEQLEGQGYGVLSFDTDGFTVGNGTGTNESGSNMVAWNWLASNTTASNTDGSITSTVSANTTSGFSIVSYTGTGANATVGHGLGVAPAFVIIKDRDNAVSWVVSGDNIGWNKNMYLDSTQAVQTANHFQDTAPTSSLMYLSTDAAVNGSSRNYIMYCFAEKKGFSKFGSYTGNGSTDGTFIYTGFKPAFVMIKRTTGAEGWNMGDNKRNITFPSGANVNNAELQANLSNAETDRSIRGGGTTQYDMLSNGFKLRGNNPEINGSPEPYIYMAFAENPLVGTNNIPATAR